jgi:hypothetical protein
MRTALLQALLILAGAAPTVRAQDDCIKNLKWPEPGRWAEYQMVASNKTPTTMRYAVVGTDKRDGTEFKWIELQIAGKTPDKNLVYQMLVPGGPAELGQVQEVVLKTGTKPAMKMNGMMMKMMRGQLEKSSFLSNICEGVSLVGEESVTVPAGTFKTLHFHNAKYDSDSWVSPSVPFTMVKTTGKDHDIQLVATGDGAKSAITEKPQEMEGMGGPSH